MTEIENPDTTTNGESLEVDETSDIQSRIEAAMRSCIDSMNEQAKTLTLEGVRRLLEKELGLDTYSLDTHKRFIKQCISPYLDGADAENGENSTGEDNAPECISEEETKEIESNVVPSLENEPECIPEGETIETEIKIVPTVDMIKGALQKRASYIRSNSDTITLAVLRRLLEGDLELEKLALDKYKHLIVEEVDKIMKNHKAKKPKKAKKEPLSDPEDAVNGSGSGYSGGKSEEEDGEEQEDAIKPKKRGVQRAKSLSKESKKRPKAGRESEQPKKRQKKPEETKSVEENKDSGESGSASEKGQSQSSGEKLPKRKDPAVRAYGKRVEHLKAIIKSCGLSVSPAIYTRVKRSPEEEREAFLIKELEDLLAREGLSSNPSEKEIKSVKRKKERAKEMEGIDLSNIVSSSRRRSTSFFPPLPEPKLSSDSGDEGALDSEDDDSTDSSNDEETDNDDGNGGADDGNGDADDGNGDADDGNGDDDDGNGDADDGNGDDDGGGGDGDEGLSAEEDSSSQGEGESS